MLKRILFRIAKSPFMGRTVGNVFRYGPWALPLERVYCSKNILAFHHPAPSYKNHLILSPRRAIGNLQQLASEELAGYFARIMEAARDIRAKHAAYRDSFVLVANGGKKQEVQQVHFHMFTDHPMVEGLYEEKTAHTDDLICVLEPQNPEWEVHYVLCPAPHKVHGRAAYLRRILQEIETLDEKCGIVEKGYSLLFQFAGKESEWERPVFHLIAGKKKG